MNEFYYFETDASSIGSVVTEVAEGLSATELKTVKTNVMAGLRLPSSHEWHLVKTNEVSAFPMFSDARSFDKTTGRLYPDLEKSRAIAHQVRKFVRGQEFTPIDNDNMNTVVISSAETARQVLRNKYDVIQINLDNAQNVAEIKGAMQAEGWIE